MRRKIVLTVAGLAAILFIYKAFFQPEEEISYLTEMVWRGDITKTVNATGEVAAGLLVSVGAQVSGQIQSLAVGLGQEVKKGDLIAEIDSTTQQNELAISKAKLNTYESQLIARQVALKVAEAQFEREVRLKARNATSDENLENAENALSAAEAGVDETVSLIAQTRISVSTAETNLGYTRIVAPLDGTVVSIPVEAGQTVNANQTTPTIVQVADLNTMEIKMQISEGDVTKVKPGLAVTYTILSEPDRLFTGTLSSVDPALTTLSDGTYEKAADSATAVYYYGKLLASNEDRALRIGMTTQSSITIAEVRDALIIPSIAITRRGGRSVVQVLEKERPVEREIRTGLSDNMNTQVLEGLKEGEEVVAAQMSASELADSANVRMRGRPRL